MRKCTDGAADLPDRCCVLRAHESHAIAAHLVEPESERESERSWFSVNTVCASDLWRCSPLAFAGSVNTPVLIIHSDGDLRCPVSQADEWFAALRLQNKPVEFVRYPASSSHGLSRNGPPDLRIDRLKRNLGWLDKYLK